MHRGRRSPGGGPRFLKVLVLSGAISDLLRRKLLLGLFHLASAGFISGCRIIDVALDDIDAEGARLATRTALEEFGTRRCRRPTELPSRPA